LGVEHQEIDERISEKKISSENFAREGTKGGKWEQKRNIEGIGGGAVV